MPIFFLSILHIYALDSTGLVVVVGWGMVGMVVGPRCGGGTEGRVGR